MKLTYHCSVQRADRVRHIVSEIGLGQVVKEHYVYNYQRMQAGREGCYLCITDTGIVIVKTEDKMQIVTMYVATYRDLLMIYDGPKKIPTYLHKKVDRNQSKYTKDGKTIWK